MNLNNFDIVLNSSYISSDYNQNLVRTSTSLYTYICKKCTWFSTSSTKLRTSCDFFWVNFELYKCLFLNLDTLLVTLRARAYLTDESQHPFELKMAVTKMLHKHMYLLYFKMFLILCAHVPAHWLTARERLTFFQFQLQLCFLIKIILRLWKSFDSKLYLHLLQQPKNYLDFSWDASKLNLN